MGGRSGRAGREAPKPHPHSIFKPATKKPNFAICVAVNVVRILALLVVLVGLAGVGIVVGIAKGYVETAPTLDLHCAGRSGADLLYL